MAEVVSLLRDTGARPAPGGPLSEVPGVAWVTVPDEKLPDALTRLTGLGYTGEIDLVAPLEEADPQDEPVVVRWKRRDVMLVRVYEESDESLLPGAPDRRTFLLECGDGVVRPITGYRGGRGPLERRALPVIDARLLANLVAVNGCGRFLEPFAGAGGVVIAANQRGFTTVSVDRDPALRYGLAALAGQHIVGDASKLPFTSNSFDAVASEPPYHPEVLNTVVQAVFEMARVLRPGGRLALLLAAEQVEAVREAGGRAGLSPELDVPINRKGTSVACLSWSK